MPRPASTTQIVGPSAYMYFRRAQKHPMLHMLCVPRKKQKAEGVQKVTHLSCRVCTAVSLLGDSSNEGLFFGEGAAPGEFSSPVINCPEPCDPRSLPRPPPRTDSTSFTNLACILHFQEAVDNAWKRTRSESHQPFLHVDLPGKSTVARHQTLSMPDKDADAINW